MKKILCLLFLLCPLYSILAQTSTWYNDNETQSAADVLIGTIGTTPKSKLHIYQEYNCGVGEVTYLNHRQVTFELSPNNPVDISNACPQNKFHIGLNLNELYFYSFYKTNGIKKKVPFFIDAVKGTGVNNKLYFGVPNVDGIISNNIIFSDVSNEEYVFSVVDNQFVSDQFPYEFISSLQLIPLNSSGMEDAAKAIVFNKKYESGTGDVKSFDLYVHGDIRSTEEIKIGKIDDDYDEHFSLNIETDYLDELDVYSNKLTISRKGDAPADIISFRENGKVEIGDFKQTTEALQKIVNNNSNMDDYYRLAVDGGIMAKQVWVSQEYWPDDVFDKGQSLISLSKLKLYIDKNKHLPGIPSVAEVSARGINLGDMDAKLLSKIEELTLYVIEQQEKIERIEKKNRGYSNGVYIGALCMLFFSLMIAYQKIQKH